MRIWFNHSFSSIHAVLRNLWESDRTGKLVLVFSHNHLQVPGAALADETYLEPGDLSDAEYVEWSIRFCQQKHIDLFWPGRAAIAVNQNRERYAAIGTQIVAVADAEVLTLLHNKADFYAQLDHNIAVPPDAIQVNCLAEFDHAYASLRDKHEQICVKPSKSVFGLGFRIIDESRDSITHLLKGIEHQIPINELRYGMEQAQTFATLLVMEYLAGHEWSVDCVAAKGHLWCAVQRKKPLQAGHAQIIDNNVDIAGMVARLTEHYRLNGLFNIQFKQGKHGPKLLEINTRPSGGVGMAMLSGADLANMALQALLTENPTPFLATLNLAYGRRVAEVNTPIIMDAV